MARNAHYAAGTRVSDSRVLVYILYNPGATSKEIFLGTGTCFGTLSQALGRLEKEGLVTHVRDPGMNGYYHYSVTPKFGELVSRVEAGIREEQTRYSARIRKVKKEMGGKGGTN